MMAKNFSKSSGTVEEGCGHPCCIAYNPVRNWFSLDIKGIDSYLVIVININLKQQ